MEHNTGADDEIDEQDDDLNLLLAKYFEPANDLGFRKCRVCEMLPPGKRGGSSGVVVRYF